MDVSLYGLAQNGSTDMFPRFLAWTLAVRICGITFPPLARCRLTRDIDGINRLPHALPHPPFPSPFHPSRRYSTSSATASAASTTVETSNPPSMYPPIEPYDSGTLRVTSLHNL